MAGGSLQRRFLLGGSLVLALFLGLAGWALDAAFRQRSERALEEQLLAQVYGLLAAAGEDERGRLQLPEMLADPRFNRPDSGLYASVKGEEASYAWRSASLLGRDELPGAETTPGRPEFRQDERFAYLHFALLWEGVDGKEYPYQLTVALDRGPLRQQSQAFRRTLWWWLGGSGVALVLLQLLLLRWGLAPLRRVAAEIHEVEQGAREQISGESPSELSGLVDNLNSLITHGRASQVRYRNSLGDLAHSLKTPLAVLQAAHDESASALLQAAGEQLPRINEILQYQLQRAALAGGGGVLQRLPLRPAVEQVCKALSKVYSEKRVSCDIAVDPDMSLRMEAGDLMELLGNLLDNAFKYGERRVVFSAVRLDGGVELRVEDDGAGIRPEDAERLLRRGERADQQRPGQGIGLGVVAELLRLYDGRLFIERSSLGGACLRITFS